MTYKAITTKEQVDTLDQDLLVKGYLAGLHSAPNYTQKDQAYWHGYLNGQVDAGKLPASLEQHELARDIVKKMKAN